jgi:hypothetical protein
MPGIGKDEKIKGALETAASMQDPDAMKEVLLQFITA